MSRSIYLVSSNEITNKEALDFFVESQAFIIKGKHPEAQVTVGPANVWVAFLGSSILKESDEEEIEAWSDCLGENACSFFELTIGKDEKSMELAIKIARESMQRWKVVVDDLYETVYNEKNLYKILE